MKFSRIPSFLSLLALASCTAESENSAVRAQYQAEVIRTEYGVAHISADSYGGLGYGEAYAAAEDHVCNMALALAQSRGEAPWLLAWTRPAKRSARYCGQGARDSRRANTAFAEQSSDVREWLQGYAAGYNDFLAANPDGVGSWCDTADWVRAATAEEFMAQYLMLLQTLPRVAQAITAAAPPPSKRKHNRTGSNECLTGRNTRRWNCAAWAQTHGHWATAH